LLRKRKEGRCSKGSSRGGKEKQKASGGEGRRRRDRRVKKKNNGWGIRDSLQPFPFGSSFIPKGKRVPTEGFLPPSCFPLAPL